MRIATCLATREERLRPMACDLLVRDPILSRTHAVDLAVPPERAWPWLAQMGAGRGGWYSWDRLDNGGRRSADRLLPELQHVSAGDLLPAVPGSRDAFVVVAVEPPHRLALHWPSPTGASRATWEFLLSAAPRGSRLVVRARLGALALEAPREPPGRHAAPAERLERALLRAPLALARPLGALGHRVMQARQLRGIRRRAEAPAPERPPAAGR